MLCALFVCGNRIETIDLEGNNISTGSCTAIPHYITRNTPLTRLYLANNNLNDEDAVLIAKALKQNDNLRVLRLHRNHITNVGIDTIRKACYDPKSLNSVSDCNHTCRLQLSGDDGNFNYNNQGCGDKLVNRRLKLYHLLSSRNREESNAHHLNLELDDEDNDSLNLKFAPEVLKCVHHYYPKDKDKHLLVDPENSVHPLSIMYETLGSWKMPSLFERQG